MRVWQWLLAQDPVETALVLFALFALLGVVGILIYVLARGA